jgi:hypothetical protein
LPFSAQKTHVKPPSQLTPFQTATSAWHFSSAQPDILDIDRKKDNENLRGPIYLTGDHIHNSFVVTILDVSHLL